MRQLFYMIKSIFFVLVMTRFIHGYTQSLNQTPDVSPIFPNSELPFRIRIETVKDKQGNDFLLPMGLQSYDVGVYEGKWLLLNGRTNGLHGFDNNPNNFPPDQQNQTVYVVDPVCQTVKSRSLTDPLSGLNQDQIESLSVTNTQAYQEKDTLYITGGYGFRSAANNFVTFPVLSAVDIPGLMRWVTHPECSKTASTYIRQLSDPIFQITGGQMNKVGKHDPTLLVLGQDFEGAYKFGPVTQVYSEQVRRFIIQDNGTHLGVKILPSKPLFPNPNYRRRDLNVVPVIASQHHGKFNYGLVALSGVFTVEGGVWTVPVKISANGNSYMPNPLDPLTFKQGMNNYDCANVELYSEKTKSTYIILLGGISYGFFENGVFETDPEIPFINQVTTIKMDELGLFTQYLMDAEYPVILSTESNPGNRLLFGANAQFIPANGSKRLQYRYEIFKLDKIKRPTVLGYIVGGIQSTLPNTNTMSDSAASPYIFKLILEPTQNLY